eukprot:Opistho-2@63450
MAARVVCAIVAAFMLAAPALAFPSSLDTKFTIKNYNDFKSLIHHAAERLGIDAVETIPNINCTYIDMCDEAKICRKVCQHGSVVLDAWAVNAIRTQYLVNMDTPLQNVQLPGTHNSAISYAEGHGLEDEIVAKILQTVDKATNMVTANQQVSIVDQMRMGVHQVEVDVHFWDGDLRVCHAGGVHVPALDKLVTDLSKALGIAIDWDSETLGCFGPQDRLFDDVLAEMRTYINTVPDEVFVLFFDNEGDLTTWNKTAEFVSIVTKNFADIAFIPSDKDKYPGDWPTPREMLAAGKRLLLLSGTNYGDILLPNIFYKYGPQMSGWSEFGPGSFTAGYPACTLKDNNNTIVTDQGVILRILADSTIYGPFYYGPSGGLLTATNTPNMVECNVQYPCLDQMVPEDSEWFVWCWAQSEPAQSHPAACATLNGAAHRWSTTACDKSMYAACQSTTDKADWKLSASPVTWAAAATACPSGYKFSTPTDGLMNRRLADTVVASKTGDAVWISLTQF